MFAVYSSAGVGAGGAALARRPRRTTTEPAAERPPEPPREPRRRWLTVPQENVVAACALVLSLVVASINAFYTLRGPEVVVRPADQVLFYRDGEGEFATLTAAVPLVMINVAGAEHGDVLVEAHLTLAGQRARFRYQTLVLPVFREDAKAARERCAVDVRCTAFDDMLIVERVDELVDVPGGAAKARFLTFSLQTTYCEGPDCRKFADFDRALAALAGKPGELAVEMEFHGDGKRRLTCDLGELDLSYVTGGGWIAVSCANGRVERSR